MAHHLHLKKRDLKLTISQAEDEIRRVCNSEMVGSGCRTQCITGGMIAIGMFAKAVEGGGRTMQGTLAKLPGGKLGIIVSPFEDCPKNFEEIIVKGGKNDRVKICRLGPDVRKKSAPKGLPAHKGPLRRKTKPRYLPGITARDIEKAD